MLLHSLAMRRVGMMAAGALSVMLSAGLSGCTMWKEPKVSTWKNTTSVEAMERLLWDEIKAGNWVEVEAHLASNVTSSTSEGVLDKAALIARLKRFQGVESSLGEFTVTDNGDTTVVHYVATVPGGQRRHTSVWQKQKQGWVMIAHADGVPMGQAAASTPPKM
ncbi:MAG TPA: nuclear transport factor 2 family protein [Terriglobales bacterium]|nr:nuclear transport factor 2 family protein [Terriglobales bacterium]